MNRPAFAVGLVFGFIIAAARLSDYNVIHDMLLLREPDVFLLMGSAFATAAPLLYLLNRRGWKTPSGETMVLRRSPVLPRNVLGAIVLRHLRRSPRLRLAPLERMLPPDNQVAPIARRPRWQTELPQ